MAGLAILANLLPVLRHMLIVVAPETAWSIDVTDVVGVGPERHLHLRKNAATIDVLRRKDGPVDFVALSAVALSLLRLIEIAKGTRNRVARRLLRRIAPLERF